MSLLDFLVFEFLYQDKSLKKRGPKMGVAHVFGGNGSIREMTAEVKDLKGHLEGRQLDF